MGKVRIEQNKSFWPSTFSQGVLKGLRNTLIISGVLGLGLFMLLHGHGSGQQAGPPSGQLPTVAAPIYTVLPIGTPNPCTAKNVHTVTATYAATGKLTGLNGNTGYFKFTRIAGGFNWEVVHSGVKVVYAFVTPTRGSPRVYRASGQSADFPAPQVTIVPARVKICGQW